MTTVLVTGAAGFVGRAVVDRAVTDGLVVRAQVRRQDAELDCASVQQQIADLRADDLEPLTQGVDVVVHCAAAKRGDFHSQYASTVRGTQRLLEAAAASGVHRFVLCSSIAVYDYAGIPTGAVVDEDAPLSIDDARRDAYTQTKVLQEQVVRAACAAEGIDLVVLRPGVVYGGDSWWTYRVGERFGRVWLALGARSSVPLVHVDDCAAALVLAATQPDAPGHTYNVVAPDPPTQREYRKVLGAATVPRPVVVPVPWPVARAVAGTVDRLTQRSRMPWRLPGFLVPTSLAVRAKPMRFDGAALQRLGWRPVHRWRDDLSAEASG